MTSLPPAVTPSGKTQFHIWKLYLVLQETNAEHSSGTSWYSPGIQDSGISNEVVVVGLEEVDVIVSVVVSTLSLVSKSSKPSGTR